MSLLRRAWRRCRETYVFRACGTNLELDEKPNKFLHENRCRIGRLHGNMPAKVFRQPYATDPGASLSLAYLRNGGTLENAAIMANHASTRTTQLYDRRRDEISLDEVERIKV
jgi:hypothetical protein